MTDEGTGLVHGRHFTPQEANEMLPRLSEMLRRLRDARDELVDEDAHSSLSEAAPGNGGGEPGRQVGVAFLDVRGLLGTIEQAGILLRDIDRGLVDFPALIDGREVYLCWELGEDGVGYWHELDSGYRGREPLR